MAAQIWHWKLSRKAGRLGQPPQYIGGQLWKSLTVTKTILQYFNYSTISFNGQTVKIRVFQKRKINQHGKISTTLLSHRAKPSPYLDSKLKRVGISI